jgi:O-antigen biosynthesis protein
MSNGRGGPPPLSSGDLPAIAREFARLRRDGVNAVSVRRLPPRPVLDLAGTNGIYILSTVVPGRSLRALVARRSTQLASSWLRTHFRSVAGHPAILGVSVIDPLPAGLIDAIGRGKVERHLEAMADLVKQIDPDVLITQTVYSTAEPLQLATFDFAHFTLRGGVVSVEASLARLQHLAGDRPVLITGVPRTRSDGPRRILETNTDEQSIRTAYQIGYAGVFVRPREVEAPAALIRIMGSSDRATFAAGTATPSHFGSPPLPFESERSPASVIVCTHNGARTLRSCLEGIGRLDYPNYEVIVVDDGSTDASASIAQEFPFRLIRTPNQGLSAARNVGLAAATGEIVAFIDDDAYPDPHWLQYIAATLQSSDHAGVGGPNLLPPRSGEVAWCVSRAPGGPTHVLLSDTEAEHIPGCNMAFRRDALLSVGGFDPQFRAAGDDVDLCWRLQERGWNLGFNPGAVVWHHRRSSIRGYWRQQEGYGRAEALLARKWPQRYNSAGHLTWAGGIYGDGAGVAPVSTSGKRKLRRLADEVAANLAQLPLMPELHLVIAGLAVITLLGLEWSPLLNAVPVLLLALAAPVVRAAAAATAARPRPEPSGRTDLATRGLLGLLYLLQPLARLRGRLLAGLWPGRSFTVTDRSGVPRMRDQQWRETAKDPHERLRVLETSTRLLGARSVRGDPDDAWDLELRVGAFGAARIFHSSTELADGARLVRARVRQRFRAKAYVGVALLIPAATGAGASGAWLSSLLLACGGLGIVFGAACGSHRSGRLAARALDMVRERP